MEADPGVRLPRLPNSKWLVGFALAALALGGAGFVAGSQLKTPEEAAVDLADSIVPVTVQVELRSVNNRASLQGSVVPGRTLTIVTNTQPGVVTSISVTKEAVVSGGALLGSIADRPLIVLSMPIPLYRPLAVGDTGPDVSRFQESLSALDYGVETNGRLDWATLNAWTAFYRNVGFEPPGGAGTRATVQPAELAQIPGNNATVIATASLGAILAPEDEFVALQVEPDVVELRATVLEIDQFAVGDPVEVTSASESFEGTVAMISDFQDGGDGGRAGYDITIAVPEDAQAFLDVGVPVIVSAVDSGDLDFAIPTIAIREDDHGFFVMLADTSLDLIDRRVEIVIREQGSGWTAIAKNSELPEGTLIAVRP